MKNTAQNSPPTAHRIAALPAENARERNSRIGSIGAGARSSQVTNAASSAIPPASAVTTSALRQPAAFPRTSPHTSPSTPAVTSASPRRSSPASGPWLSVIRRSTNGISASPIGTLSQKIHGHAMPCVTAPPTSGPPATASPLVAKNAPSDRILGSVQDVEDLVQETLLAAWRGLAAFEERASLRTWLYRIATNRCLNALRDRGRTAAGMLGADPPAAAPEPTRWGEPVWLQPYPDALLDGLPDRADGPDVRYETREAIGLAFVAGLQRMPPAQRAVPVLRDVLGYRAAEVAEMLGASEASVNSGLQRARAALAAAPERPVGGTLPDSPAERALLSRFADAFEHGDVDAVVALLTDDAWIRMPPQPHEYQGRAAIAGFLRTRGIWIDPPATGGGRGVRLVATRANGRPAFGYYLADPHAGVLRAGGVLVVETSGDAIAAITRFGDTGVLPYFGLPRTLPA